MDSNWQEMDVQLFHIHGMPNMQLISFNELQEFDLKHGNTENTSLES